MTGLQKKIVMLSPSKIKDRTSLANHSLNVGRLKGLMESISLMGILEPITVRKKDKQYEVIKGFKRLHAAKIIGIKKIPCLVYDIDDKDAVVFSLVREIQSESMNYLETAQSINSILKNHPISKRELAMKLGITLENLLYRLEPLRFSEEIREKLDFYAIEEETARLLLKLPPDKRNIAVEKIGSEQLSYGESARLVDKILNFREEVKKENTPFEKTVIGDIRIFSNSLIKLVEVMRKSGFNAHYKKSETEKYTEYKIRIIKNTVEKESPQLKII